jgi:uncharacterized membrane protein YgcG
VKLKERGNLEFKNGDYMQAMELYSEAIKAQKSKTKTDVSQSRDLAVLYGNRSECFLKMSYLEFHLSLVIWLLACIYHLAVDSTLAYLS